MDHIENYWPVFSDGETSRLLMRERVGEPVDIALVAMFNKHGAISAIRSMYAAFGWKGGFGDLNVHYKERQIIVVSGRDAVEWLEREIPKLAKSKIELYNLEQQITTEIAIRRLEAKENYLIKQAKKIELENQRPKTKFEEILATMPKTKEDNFKRMKELLKM